MNGSFLPKLQKKFPQCVNITEILCLFTQFFCPAVSGINSGHDRTAETGCFQRIHACDGGAAGGADLIFELPGVLACLQKKLGCAQQHLCCVGHGFVPGETADHSAVCQRFHEHGSVGRAAACHGATGIDQRFRQAV